MIFSGSSQESLMKHQHKSQLQCHFGKETEIHDHVQASPPYKMDLELDFVLMFHCPEMGDLCLTVSLKRIHIWPNPGQVYFWARFDTVHDHHKNLLWNTNTKSNSNAILGEKQRSMTMFKPLSPPHKMDLELDFVLVFHCPGWFVHWTTDFATSIHSMND